MTTVYEHSFDWNEWTVIIALLSLHYLVWILPKIFSFLQGSAYYLYGIVTIMFFDHTISVPPWDFYDVNDSSHYQLIDFLTYVMSGPVSYFFIYYYVKLGIKGLGNLLYLILASGLGVLVEYGALQIGIYHYDKGYTMYWSFPIYFSVQSILIIYHHLIQQKEQM